MNERLANMYMITTILIALLLLLSVIDITHKTNNDDTCCCIYFIFGLNIISLVIMGKGGLDHSRVNSKAEYRHLIKKYAVIYLLFILV